MANQQSITKQEADRLMQNSCQTRGEEIFELAVIIKKKYGDEGIRKVEEKLSEWGYPTSLSQVRFADWYPEGLNVLLILAAREVFGWTDEDIFDYGKRMPKFSFGVKLFIKYFVSPKKTFELCSEYWQKFVTCGEIEPVEINETEKYCILRLKNYQFHPVMCHYFRGYFLAIAENAQKGEKMTIKETKCMFRGDPYHEYLMRW